MFRPRGLLGLVKATELEFDLRIFCFLIVQDILSSAFMSPKDSRSQFSDWLVFRISLLQPESACYSRTLRDLP